MAHFALIALFWWMTMSLGMAFSPSNRPPSEQHFRPAMTPSTSLASYLDGLSPDPPKQGELKPASYPKRPLEEETNPMMVARHFLDRLNGPPPPDVAEKKKPVAPSTGTYLDQLSTKIGSSQGSFE